MVLALFVGVFTWLVISAAREPSRLRLTAATETVVELPDGREVEGFAGLLLPDGAVVRTGGSGSATAGAVRLGPDEVGVVGDGELMPAPGHEGPAPRAGTFASGR